MAQIYVVQEDRRNGVNGKGNDNQKYRQNGTSPIKWHSVLIANRHKETIREKPFISKSVGSYLLIGDREENKSIL